jgi:hypothetical protein
MMKTMNSTVKKHKIASIILPSILILNGCTSHAKHEHFNVESDEGFFRSYVYTEIKQDGKVIPGSGKLTLCNGYAGFVSDIMKNAAIVGSAYLIGAGLGDSGDSSSTNINNRLNNNSNASSVSNANANAGASSSSVSGAGASVTQPRPHYRELKPHEYGKYGVD